MTSRANNFRYILGNFFREAGESMDRVGSFLQGSAAHKERCALNLTCLFLITFKIFLNSE